MKNSSLFGLDEKGLKDSNAEFLVLLKGYDDTFSQTVNDRFSFIAGEIVWGAKFVNIFGTADDGMGTVALVKIGEYERASLD